MSNHIIAVGSVDGVLTGAAVMAHLGDAQAKISFCQAFTIHTVKVEQGDQLWLVDLAVNNSPIRQAIPELGLEAGAEGWQYTGSVVHSWLDTGAEIKAIVDEHDAQAWEGIIPAELWSSLVVKPMSQGLDEGVFSAGDVLRLSLDTCSGRVMELCFQASEADQGRFVGEAEVVNKAVKAAIQDNARREHCARHLAFNPDPSARMLDWASEYDELQRNAQEIISSAADNGSWVFVDTRKKVDMTSLAFSLYKAFPDATVVVAKGQAYNKEQGGVIPVHSFMASNTAPKDINLQQVIGLDGFGFARKWNVVDAVADEAMAKLVAYLA